MKDSLKLLFTKGQNAVLLKLKKNKNLCAIFCFMMLKTVAFSMNGGAAFSGMYRPEQITTGLIPVFGQDLLHCSVHGAAAR